MVSVLKTLTQTESAAPFKCTFFAGEELGNLGDINERVVKFRPTINAQSSKQGFTSFSSDQFGTGQTFNNSNGTGGATGGFGSAAAGGTGGGFTRGGGAGFGHTFTKPTYGIALKITEEATKGKREQNRYAQLMMTSMNNYELELEDKDGNVYLPSGASATGNGGGSSQSFSFNGITQNRSSQLSEPELSTVAFRFKPVQNYSIKSITARIVEPDGEPETVPFTIEVKSEPVVSERHSP